ncbi:MAG: hypothetical protein AUJ85_06685 [Elusimicrobia bacterium CG1_02_37_114]|nr:MAG: hypothetical protein AUJ85_06685 [Elusimicrobia bacterium CG1_02_37_114]PIV53371.1 MAG: hypothetical protein COS17_04245 [Elusimicrobia bacterium CG02_land_8_20_14_3_00_37_13]PIZ13152.1 MAG: hypothetical protein COY53_06290 [Elusimicrobia bacterium CG_4_10_14_0_8_um_filter_37_32]
MGEEKRQYTRFVLMQNLAKPLDLFIDPPLSETQSSVPAVLLDLSAGGMGLLTFATIKTETKVKIKINLPGLKTNNIDGKIVWSVEKGESCRLGLLFTKIEPHDFDNIKHIAEDYADCETKLSLGVRDVCFKDCRYHPLCTKPVKAIIKR